MHPDAAVGAVAMRQHGLVTRAQALAAGMTPDRIRVRVDGGRWAILRRGVYVICGTPPSERQAVLAAVLAAGGEVVASHRTAAQLWGMTFPVPDGIEVTGRCVRLDGVISHRTGTLVPDDRTVLGSIPVMAPARTIVACSGSIPAWRLGYVVDDALRRGIVRLCDLRACHERVATGPGRRPTVALSEVLAERASGYRAGDSAPEATITRALAVAGLPAPVLGHRVRVGRRTYRLDIAWPEALLAIEHDGWDVHRTFSAFHGDRQRLRRLVTAGWTIIPSTARTDVGELVRDVTHLLCARLAVG